MAPAVSSTWNVRDIHCPPLIAALRTASESMDARPRRQRTLMHEPALEHQQSIHRLAVHADPFDETQHRPQAPVTEGRIFFDQLGYVPPGLRRAAAVPQQLPRAPAAGHGKISELCRLCASRRRATSLSFVGRPRRRRAPCSLAQNVQVHGQLADLALEPIDFFFAQRLVFLLASTQCILCPTQEAIAPRFYLGDLQPVSPGRLSGRRLTLEQADYQSCATLGLQRCTSSGRESSAICHLAGLFDLVLLVAQFPKGAG